jgi:hypothetical protein
MERKNKAQHRYARGTQHHRGNSTVGDGYAAPSKAQLLAA